MVNNGRFAALAMPVVQLEGGALILIGGNAIGAVGVSGVKAGADAQVARAAIAALLTNLAHPTALAATNAESAA